MDARDQAVPARARRRGVARRQQPGVRGAPRARRLGSRHLQGAAGGALVRPRRLPAPHRGRPPRGVLLDEGARRPRSTPRRDLRHRRRPGLAGHRPGPQVGPGRARPPRRRGLAGRDALCRRRQQGGPQALPGPRLRDRPHRPGLHRRDRAGHVGLGGMPGPYDLTSDDLAGILDGEPAYRVRQIWDGLHRRALRAVEMSELPRALRARLAEEPGLAPALRETARSVADRGQTLKWRWALEDGAAVETVLMHYRDRTTVCVSTQAGCAMACGFCATGQAGFTRHLSPGEIVEQVIAAIRQARPRRLSNVVFMGMGEPLANYDRVWAAVTRLHDDVGISARHLTLSTVGLVPGIRRLAGETLPVNLAVSLHAANDELRDGLVPINRRYPLAELATACAEYVAASGRRLSIEWALIDGVNDRMQDVAELAV